jgi:hypothetical protein
MQKYEKCRGKCKIFIKISKEKKKKCVSVNQTFTLSEPGLCSIRLANHIQPIRLAATGKLYFYLSQQALLAECG